MPERGSGKNSTPTPSRVPQRRMHSTSAGLGDPGAGPRGRISVRQTPGKAFVVEFRSGHTWIARSRSRADVSGASMSFAASLDAQSQIDLELLPDDVGIDALLAGESFQRGRDVAFGGTRADAVLFAQSLRYRPAALARSQPFRGYSTRSAFCCLRSLSVIGPPVHGRALQIVVCCVGRSGRAYHRVMETLPFERFPVAGAARAPGAARRASVGSELAGWPVRPCVPGAVEGITGAVPLRPAGAELEHHCGRRLGGIECSSITAAVAVALLAPWPAGARCSAAVCLALLSTGRRLRFPARCRHRGRLQVPARRRWRPGHGRRRRRGAAARALSAIQPCCG
jgi:hypothetical protein